MKFRNAFFSKCCYITLIFFLCFACSDEEPISSYHESVIAYFKSIALGFEYGVSTNVTRKWLSPMKIFVGGDKYNVVLLNDLNQAITGINNLATDGFRIETTTDSAASNCYLFFGSKEEFETLFPDAAGSMGSNLALFNVWWEADTLNRARIFIDISTTTPIQQKSLILEEVTQSIGFGRDSPQYPESIFFETEGDGGFATEYAERDRDLIRLLYHPQMRVGLSANEVDHVLRKILEIENY